MCSVGQLSDPYNQGEDNELDGVSVAGLPGEPDEPPPEDDPSSSDGESPADDEMLYDLDDWSDMERLAVADRLNEATIPFVWDGGTLQVAAIDQAPVENILDIVGGGSRGAGPRTARPRRATRSPTTCPSGRTSSSAPSPTPWPPPASTTRGTRRRMSCSSTPTTRRRPTSCSTRWRIPTSSTPRPTTAPAGAELLGSIFVAADRLQHDGGDTEGTLAMVKAAMAVDAGEPPPYGVDPKQWDHVCERVTELGDLLSADAVDEDEVEDRSRDLRTALRPFV